MRHLLLVVSCLSSAGFAAGGEKITSPTPLLTAQELAEGWILLFDGETSYGWTSDLEEGKRRRPMELKVEQNALAVGGLKNKGIQRAIPPACFDHFELQLDYRVETRGEVNANLVVFRGNEVASKHDFNRTDNASDKWNILHLTVSYSAAHKVHLYWESNKALKGGVLKEGSSKVIGPASFHVETGLGTRLLIRNVKIRPTQTRALFNGKDLTGWREFPGKKSKFTVNDKGELNIKDGPGDLQTEGQYGDFVLQLECISHGKHLNSGVFFRCRPNEYQQGYEAQIRNQFTKEATQEYKLDDFLDGKFLGKKIVKSPAIDHGTGGLQYRMPARKQMSKDGDWFAMTILAKGKHLATWVNGIQVAYFTDHRPPSDNARKGYRSEPGPMSLQGHDPTTDLSFRNIRIAEMAGEQKPK